jgi:hypothetical protein
MDLFKPPGVAETLDWAAAIQVLGQGHLSSALIHDTVGVVLKYQDDIERVQEAGFDRLLARGS